MENFAVEAIQGLLLIRSPMDLIFPYYNFMLQMSGSAYSGTGATSTHLLNK
jgi:hypothetical protein